MRLLVKYPTKRRWSRFVQNMADYVLKCHDLDQTDFLITADEDDPWPGHLSRDFGPRNNPYRVGLTVTPPRGKVAAINHGIPENGWDILVVAADDMVPEPGWDEEIRQDFKDNPNSWAINYNDDERLGKNWRDLITLPVMTNGCYRHFGWVYNPVYVSEYCDCEQTSVLSRSGRLVHINRSPIKHKWEIYQNDDLAHTNMAVGQLDKETYAQRKAAGFL
jgi:hypothetical protein